METEVVKKQLKSLINEVNSTPQRNKIRFHQQPKNTQNMCAKDANGSIWITPAPGISYDISLSGKSLEAEMKSFMRDLCGEKHGYKFPKDPRAPFWRVDNFEMVEKAVYRYANTIK